MKSHFISFHRRFKTNKQHTQRSKWNNIDMNSIDKHQNCVSLKHTQHMCVAAGGAFVRVLLLSRLGMCNNEDWKQNKNKV